MPTGRNSIPPRRFLTKSLVPPTRFCAIISRTAPPHGNKRDHAPLANPTVRFSAINQPLSRSSRNHTPLRKPCCHALLRTPQGVARAAITTSIPSARTTFHSCVSSKGKSTHKLPSAKITARSKPLSLPNGSPHARRTTRTVSGNLHSIRPPISNTLPPSGITPGTAVISCHTWCCQFCIAPILAP